MTSARSCPGKDDDIATCLSDGHCDREWFIVVCAWNNDEIHAMLLGLVNQLGPEMLPLVTYHTYLPRYRYQIFGHAPRPRSNFRSTSTSTPQIRIRRIVYPPLLIALCCLLEAEIEVRS